MNKNSNAERWIGWGLLAGIMMIAAVGISSAADLPTITEEGVISGSMTIDFQTRTHPDRSGKLADGSPAEGTKDMYTFNLDVAKTTEFAGTITRQPRLFSKVLGREMQPAELQYDITLSVRNPSNLQQKKSVGKWVGIVPIDETGVYMIDGGGAKGSPLRMAIDTIGSAQGFTENFGGRLAGKAASKQGLLPYTFSRFVGGKQVKIEVKNSDPMRFDNILLAAGPAGIYPRANVTGRLDYDYETGNWYTDGIRFRYVLNGVDCEDVATGSIKWVEDPNREQNGKGQYEFNLRFNEDKNKSATSESDVFSGGAGDEEAFFFVDNSIPSLTGTIAYVDMMIPGKEAPSSSKVTFNLNANQLNKQQIVNFLKLWLLCVGPTNDE
ncbi:MAG: hypothetical protein C4527_09370 [Candidatus Omnitrophota bacterium]|jgi:hypothetical protein|nr:MAG: hypothetical protein C4527_09370 [Candidatus Omnitrophota bacterium]